MPLYKGNTKIGAIYKGTTPISAIYKGSTLIFSSYTWQEWYVEYVYNTLVPQTLPKNLYNGTWEVGTIYQGADFSSTTALRTPANDKIKVSGGTTYYLVGTNPSTSTNSYVFEYDENGTWIDRLDKDNSNVNNALSFQLNANCRFVRLVVNINTTNVKFYKTNVNVLDKAKVSTIYGNSVVENQLVDISHILSTITTNGVTFTNNGDGTITVSGTATTTFDIGVATNIPLTQNNSFILKTQQGGSGQLKTWLVNVGSTVETYDSALIFNKTSTTNINIAFTLYSSKTYNFTFFPQIVNLTQRYPFNTPTTLTDIRVQAILNRGYIPYNTGTLKNVDMSEVSSEPYNLFDNYLEQGTINTNGTNGSSNDHIRAHDKIGVSEGQTYIIEYTSSNNLISCYVAQYDKDGNFITRGSSSGTGKTITYVVPSGVHYIRPWFYYYNGLTPNAISDFCIHIQGTRTGYAPYQAPSTLSLKYQGSGVNTVHDTMTIDNDNVVFTKRMSRVDLGSLSYTLDDYRVYTSDISNLVKKEQGLLNLICDRFAPTNVLANMTSTNGLMFVSSAGNVSFSNMGYNATTFKTAMSGVMLEYELATPQVITIPRKHIGVVDLGSLNWTIASNGRMTSSGLQQTIKRLTGYFQIPTWIYCSKYIVNTPAKLESATPPDKSMSIGGNTYDIIIYDSDYTNATTFKNAMSGQYLYYETTDESTIPNIIGVQGGGTITTNWFSWVKNQLLDVRPNYSFTLYNVAISTDGNNKITFNGTANDGGGRLSFGALFNNKNVDFVNGHKYLISSLNINAGLIATNNNSTSSWSTLLPANNSEKILEWTLGTTTCRIGWNLTNNVVYNASGYVKLIDLTLAFGSGNEPTTTSDPRIQYILSQGYISQDTTGTQTNVPTQVLPNIDFELKAK